MATVGLISLGCPRNLIDSEIMLALLKKNGFKVTEDFSKCDAAIVNTCSFIKDAKEESIDLILRLVDLKKEKKLKAIIVAGCLPQRYPAELKKEIKEIDGFLGTSDFIKIPEVLKTVLSGGKTSAVSGAPSFLADHTYPRDLITPRHSIYLKVAEGCNNNCSYCVIPKIRGALRSRRINSLLEETKRIAKRHKISEINLIGQDTTLYGTDLYGAPKLSELIRQLAAIKKARWIRVLYTHPEHYTDELIGVIRDEPSVCKYVDLPLQHINDRILKSMGRKTNKRDICNLISRLRKEIPGLAVRTTFIVGFPGETDKEFKELADFIKEARFERLGVFEYSREEGTPAHNFKNQISDNVKKERFDALMRLQQEISKEVNAGYMGKELEVLIDEPANRQTGKLYNYTGRTEYDAPEVDGNCFVRTKKQHKPGDFVKVKIVDTLEYDLVGEEL